MNPKSNQVTKDQFVAILKDSGVSEAQMASLHRLFEQRHPEAHEAFLRHLQLSDAEVSQVRAKFR